MTTAKIATNITIAAGVLGVMWYLWKLENRLHVLENQSIAVVVGNEARQSAKSLNNSSSNEADLKYPPQTIEATCSQLALRVVDLVASDKYSATQTVQSMMTKLGCIK